MGEKTTGSATLSIILLLGVPSLVGLYGWENVVDRILASAEYNNSFRDHAVRLRSNQGKISDIQNRSRG
jgi:hypothetical protein